MLENFTGYLQSDDYQVYHQHKARADVIGVACWAHARRNFDKALGSDRTRASVAMKLIQKLYAVEQESRDGSLRPDERKELRLEKSLPLLNTISAWLVQELQHTLPKSPIGKAIRYAVRLWDELMAYLYNGHLEIDNNLMENAIRPITFGRKNWLFAGSHEGAENIAMKPASARSLVRASSTASTPTTGYDMCSRTSTPLRRQDITRFCRTMSIRHCSHNMKDVLARVHTLHPT